MHVWAEPCLRQNHRFNGAEQVLEVTSHFFAKKIKIRKLDLAPALKDTSRNLKSAGKVLSEREAMRHTIANLYKMKPEASLRELSELAGCSKGVVQRTVAKLKNNLSLQDAPRSGRPQSLQGAGLARAVQIGVGSSVGSSKHVSEQLSSEGFPVVHPNTIRRAYRREGLCYGRAKRGLLLNDKIRAARLAFATKHGAGRTDFRGVMFTDSKIFVLDKAGDKVWYHEGNRPTVAVPKSSIKVHVYYGVTFFGATKPVFVTGGGSQKSETLNPKTGIPLRRVGAEEYSKNVLPNLLADGDKLYSGERSYARKWIFQQDNAPAHTAGLSKGVLESRMSGRWIMDWPACSPDLSWIENVWAWADRKLRRDRANIQSAQDLRKAIIKVFDELPVAHCKNYVNGMQKRLASVKKLKGGPIGK